MAEPLIAPDTFFSAIEFKLQFAAKKFVSENPNCQPNEIGDHVSGLAKTLWESRHKRHVNEWLQKAIEDRAADQERLGGLDDWPIWSPPPLH